jgi:thioredoxin reductase
MTNAKNFEVIIIGGSYAGLSAAMALGRSLRDVLIIDSGLRCNRQTPHAHNFITQDGAEPSVIAEKAKEEILKYDTIKIINDLAVSSRKHEKGFVVTTETGEEFLAKKLLFASGLKDMMPDIKGFAECWGITVVHCPYCHGYEIRGEKTAIMANGAGANHLASLVNNLTDDITILTMGKADFSLEEISRLNRHEIEIIETEVDEIEHENGRMNKVIFKDGSQRNFSAMYAAVKFTQHSSIPASLGCELTEQGHLKVTEFQATTIKGVFACGDSATMMRSIASSVYSGNLAGAMLNKELTEEQF